jgi:hypothetical protein
MFKSDIGRTVAAIVCTILFSTTCVLSAVGPAQAGAGAATEMAAHAQA